MSETHLIEQADRWLLPIDGAEVTQCRIDYAFVMLFDRQGTFEIRIEQRFEFVGADGEEFSLKPESDPQGVGRALVLLHDCVTKAAAHKDGRLELEFDSGATIHVAAGGGLEPWNLVGPSGLRLVSLPDGGLTIWSGRENELA